MGTGFDPWRAVDLMTRRTKPRVMAVSSCGGHWVQLRRMRAAWDGCDVAYVTTKEGNRVDVFRDAEARKQPTPRFYTVVDANRWQKRRLLLQLIGIAWIVLKERPDIIISTGAASGFFALKIGKILGARTIWVDSIANAGTLSLSGKMVGSSADLWLTQWQHLEGSMDSDRGLPEFKGSVI